MIGKLFSRNRLYVVGLVLVGTLMFIWPIPHTISLRYVLVLPALWIFCHLVILQRSGFWHPRLTLPAVALGGFVLWMVAVAVFNSSETAWSLGEIRGQWVMPLIVCYLGVLVGKNIGQSSRPDAALTLMILLPLAVHIAVVDAQGVLTTLTGKYQRIAGLTERADTSNYLTNITLALLLAETFARVRGRRFLFAIGNKWLGVSLCVAAASLIFEHIRNGVAVVAVLAIVFAMALLSDLRRSGWGIWKRTVVAGSALIVIVALVIGAASAKSGSSWERMIATVSTAWDTQHNRQWLDSDLPPPTLPDGRPVDASAYLRLAWFKEGAILVAEHPFGVGYGRNVFGHEISAKYNVPFSYHSHSSALDLTIGAGIPGIALWFGFLGILIVWAWRRLWVGDDVRALALTLLVVDYATRSLIDSNVRDHMLQQFMFLVGLFSGLMSIPAPTGAQSVAGNRA